MGPRAQQLFYTPLFRLHKVAVPQRCQGQAYSQLRLRWENLVADRLQHSLEEQLGVRCALSPFGDRNHGTVTRCGGRLRAPVACQWRHLCDVATQGLSERGNPIRYEVEAQRSAGSTSGANACKPLLREDLALRSDSLSSNAHPGVLQRFGSAGEKACAGAGGMVVTICINKAAVAMFAASV